MDHLPVEEILDPAYVDGLAAVPLDEIRSRREGAKAVEDGMSYLRRVVQGRLDIVRAEQRRRAEGLPPEDLAALVDRLPEILGDHVHAPGFGRLTATMAPGEIDPELLAQIEDVVSTDSMAHLPDLPEDRVEAIAAGLQAVEREVSSQRRALFEVLDRLQEEIVRRYRTGEATVDSLLG